MDVLYSILAFAIGISILVFVHELGHFLMAKWNGVRVEKFSIGFPPKLFSFRIGETEYVLGALPLGGYVKMAGMIDENMDEAIQGKDDEFMSKKTWQKSLILIGGVLFNFILAIVIFSFFNLKYGEKKIRYTEIQSFAPQSNLFRNIPDENIRIIQIGKFPIYYYEDIQKALIESMGDEIRIVYEKSDKLLAEVLLPENFVLSQEDVNSLHFASSIRSTIVVGIIDSTSYAKQIALQQGDTIIAINSDAIHSFNKLEVAKYKNQDSESLLLIGRADGRKEIPMKLQKNNDGKIVFGFRPNIVFNQSELEKKVEQTDFNFTSAVSKAVYDSFNSIFQQINHFKMMIRGDLSAKEHLGGPIAIAKLMGETFNNIEIYLRLLASLSIVLAFLNILPIPGLDGGHLVIVLIEGLRGKPLSIQTKIRIQQLGFLILISFMIFVFTNDISRLF